MKTIYYTLSSIILSLLLISCKVGEIKPSIEQEIPAVYTYNADSFSKSDSLSLGEIPWQTFFADSLLQLMIERALSQNTDVQLALKNIEIAQWKLKQAKSAYLPKTQVSFVASTSNPSNNSLNGRSIIDALGQNHLDDYTASVGFSWEADIWGKIKNQNKASLALYLQSQEAKKAIQTQIISQVAKGYYQLVTLYQIKDVVEANIKLSEQTYTLAQFQYEVGDINLLALEQLDTQRLIAKALLPDIEKQIALQEHILQVLCGDFPNTVAINKEIELLKDSKPLPVGIPANLLRNRPDIIQAELNVTAFDAYRRVARASMYPALNISAETGVSAFRSSDWFTLPASLFGLVAGSLTEPIFQNRTLKTKYEIARIEYEKSVIVFKQQLIQAVAEVTDALVTIEKLNEQSSIVNEQSIKLNTIVKQANLLFTHGEASYLDVVLAQSNKLHADLETIQLNKVRCLAFVDLYRALGGGKNAE